MKNSVLPIGFSLLNSIKINPESQIKPTVKAVNMTSTNIDSALAKIAFELEETVGHMILAAIKIKLE